MSIEGSLSSAWYTFNTLQVMAAFSMINFRPPANVKQISDKLRDWVLEFKIF